MVVALDEGADCVEDDVLELGLLHDLGVFHGKIKVAREQTNTHT